MAKQMVAKKEAENRLMQMELVLAFVLRYGVLLCIAIISAGVALRLLHLGVVSTSSEDIVAALRSGQMIKSSPLPVSLAEFWLGTVRLDSDVITAAGLAFLIALPIFRVGMTVVLFALEKDKNYFFITLLVLVILLSGIYFGKSL